MTLTVGQTLWYVPNETYNKNRSEIGQSVVIEKIGRKWATVRLHQRPLLIDIETLRADGGQYTSPGRCYLSADDYKTELRVKAVWGDFVSRLSRVSPPSTVTEKMIRQIADMLGVRLKIED